LNAPYAGRSGATFSPSLFPKGWSRNVRNP
jgi:hypothetical protein